MTKRKCCGTPKGTGPHKQTCPHYQDPASLKRQLDKGGVTLDARKHIVEEIGEDLPDGAFFALAQEFGIEPEDWIEE